LESGGKDGGPSEEEVEEAEEGDEKEAGDGDKTKDEL
jgi:hypothetical protein